MLERLLNKGWQMFSSDKLDVFGEKISTEVYQNDNWYQVTIPGTVVSGLVENGVYPDPYYNNNIKELPGYKTGKNTLFSAHYMPDDSPFRSSWWFRNEFTIPDEWQGKKIWLYLKGINYSANIWMNGERIAGVGEVQGTYRLYQFDISKKIIQDKKNVLAIEVFAPQPDDLAMTFIDWCPVPPDDSMGIWQPVSISVSEDISLNNTFVRSSLTNNNSKAELIIISEVYNDTEEEKPIKISGKIDNCIFEKDYLIGAKEEREIKITAEDCPELIINNPKLWWPYQMGQPELYNLELKLYQGDLLCDKEQINFGIREIETYLNSAGSRMFKINGREIQLRGAAWAPDLMLRQSEKQDRIDINYVKNMNFNTIRLEGKLASDEFWEICDREGIIVIAGWPCCNHWEKWDRWKAEDLRIAVESLRSQLKRLRNHPSMTAWFYGSDFPPVYEVEKAYLESLEECHPDLPAISSAADKPTKLTGEPGVKMSGPYSYVPPQYWYDQDMPGVAGKFNTETCPDMCIPQMDSLKKMLSSGELEVESEGWKLHSGLADFSDTRMLDRVIEGRFGKNLSLENYVKAAQFIGYQSWRAMFEAHFKNWPDATGVIGWMLNSSWPSLIWQLYDYYNMPNGAFYGSKKACESLHLQYSYDDNTIYLANQSYEEYYNLNVRVVLYNIDLQKKYTNEMKVESVVEYGKQKLFAVPGEYLDKGLSFLFLYLENDENRISKNVYYLPEGKDIYEENSNQWFHIPLKEFASFKEIMKLPTAEIKMDYKIYREKDQIKISVKLKNQSEFISCFNQLKVYDKDEEIINPVYWSDNYVTILPGEQEELTAIIKRNEVKSVENLHLSIECFN